MTRIPRYSSKPISFRLKKEVEQRFKKFCAKLGVNESEVIQAAVGCFIDNKDCTARKELKK